MTTRHFHAEKKWSIEWMCRHLEIAGAAYYKWLHRTAPDEASLRYAIKDYLRFYSEERPQERYHCKTPLEVRHEALASDMPVEYPIPENKRINKYKKKWCA